MKGMPVFTKTSLHLIIFVHDCRIHQYMAVHSIKYMQGRGGTFYGRGKSYF